MTSSKSVMLKIGEELIDITNLSSFTIGDKKELAKLGINFAKIADISPDDEAKLIGFILRKVRPTTTDVEVDALPIKVGQDVLRHAVNRSAEIDSPLSLISTPSDGITGGEFAN